MKTFTIDWLNKCRCGNKSHTVKTARGNETALWDDDAVKCNSCGRGGVIQVCEGQARVLWETDEEMAEGKPMSTITKERLQWLANISGRDDIDDIDGGEIRELALIALASLEAEPVAWMRDDADGREYNARNEFSGGGGGVPLYAPPQVQVVPEAEPIAVSDDMAYAFHHALSDSSPGADEVEEIKAGLRAAFANVTAQPEPVVPDEIGPNDSNTFDYVDGWNACRAAMLHGAEPVSQTYKLNQLSGNSPVTPGGWISCSDRIPEDTKMLLAFSQGEIVAAYWNWVVNPIDYKKYRAFTYLSGYILDDVTHWMPLPEPPL